MIKATRSPPTRRAEAREVDGAARAGSVEQHERGWGADGVPPGVVRRSFEGGFDEATTCGRGRGWRRSLRGVSRREYRPENDGTALGRGDVSGVGMAR